MKSNKSIRRFLAFLLCAAIIITYMPTPRMAFADDGSDDVAVVQEEPAPAPEPETVSEPAPAPEPEPAPAVETEPAEEPEAPEAEEPAPGEDSEEAEEPAQGEEPADAEEPEEIIEETEEEITYPAVSFEKEVNGMTVKINAPEGALPEGASVSVTTVAASEIEDAVKAKMGDEYEVVKAVDITFFDKDGNKIEPEKPVSVKFISGKIKEADNVSVLHIDDNGKVEMAENGNVSGSTASFRSDDFSIYVVVEGRDPDARLFVNFYEADGETLIASMSLTLNQFEAGQMNVNIYDPGTGTMETGDVFKGWIDKKNFTVEDADDGDTIADVRERVKTMLNAGTVSDGDHLDYYAMMFKSYHVSYLDELEVTIYTDEVLYKKGDENIPYTFQFAYTPYYVTGSDEEDETKAANFDGWKQVAPEVTPAQVYDNGDEINLAGYDLSGTSQTLTVMAQVAYGHWLVFNENASGASYTEPLFVGTDETHEEAGMPAAPSRPGYSFGGWYTDSSCAEGKEFDPTQPITETTNVWAKWDMLNEASFNVLVWRESLSGGYDFVKSVEIKNAETGYVMTDALEATVGESSVMVNDQEVFIPMDDDESKVCEGFTYEKCEPNTEDGKVASDGSSVLNVYFIRRTYTLKFYYARSQKSGGEPIYERHNIGTANNGTIAGVTGEQNADYFTTETGNTRVYWRKGYFRTGTGNNSQRYSGAVWERVQTGTSGGTETYQVSQNYEGWNPTRWSNTTGTTKPGSAYGGEGSEQRGGYTYYYRTLTAKYGAYIGDKWPTYNGTDFEIWNNLRLGSWAVMQNSQAYQHDGQGTIKGKITTMNEQILGDLASADGNYVYANYDTTSSQYDWVYHIYFKNGSGQYVLYENVSALSHDSGTNWQTQQHPPAYPGMTEVRRERVGNNREINYYYDRLTYPILFKDGVYENGSHHVLKNNSAKVLDSKEGEDAIAYEADISGYNSYDPTEKISDGANYVFLGWYADDQCKTKYNFDKMPLGGVTVYAKWVLKEYKVTLNPKANGDASFKYINGKPVGEYGPNGDVMYVDNGGKVGNVGGTRDYYDLIGWFTNEGLTKVWDFEAFTMNDTIVGKYGELYKRDGTDSRYDPAYPGTVGEINLYASWRRILDGADGINVVYTAEGKDKEGNTVTGSNAPADPNSYSDQAQAIARPACNAPAAGEGETQLAFQYWVVQTWNDTAKKYEDNDQSQRVYPGDRFRVNYDDAKAEAAPTPDDPYAMKYTIRLRPQYGSAEDATPTHIYWYNNYVDSAAGIIHKDEPLAINQSVVIQGAPTRTGYEFLGWARKPETNADRTENYYTHDVSEDDLFLTYNSATGKYTYTTTGGEAKSATGVFADERTPYDGMYAVWKALDVKYTVEYYYMNDDGTYPATATSSDDTRKAKTDTDVSVTTADKVPNDTVKYALDNSETYSAYWSGKVKGDGSLVLKVFFKKNKFTVTWKSQDGNTELEKDENVAYNVSPSFDGAEPTKAEDEQYTYTFAGWATSANQESGKKVSELPKVKADAVYYAAFSKTEKTFTVTWKNQDGTAELEKDENVAYNVSPSFDGKRTSESKSRCCILRGILKDAQEIHDHMGQ